ncbi:MAG: transposase, partial [Paracoccaceae bacterium]
PVLTEMCGFFMGALPDESQFYRFLKHTKNSVLENIHLKINRALVNEGVVSLDTFIIDSKPVMAATRQNNFKNPRRNTRDKTRRPTRNPQATLGYYSYQQVGGHKNNYMFFWGYRTHVIVSAEGVPFVEATLPNNKTDAQVAKKLIRKLKRLFKFKNGAIFIADAAYDERDIYNLIVEKMKSKAIIPINPRNQKPEKTFGPHGCPMCETGLEMRSAGSWTEGLRTRLKFRCPLKADRAFAKKYPVGCPVKHQRFFKDSAYGCTKYLDVTDDARAQVPRDTKWFKTTYRKRIVVEQYFARLGNREVEQTSHYKLRSVQNQMTIAHLSMSLIAKAAAVLMQQPEKIRCYRTFAKVH